MKSTALKFSLEQVIALCGGKLPDPSGYTRKFDWNKVGYFLLEEGVLRAYSSDHLTLLVPGISVQAGLAVTHVLSEGRALCRFSNEVPRDWAPGHTFVSFEEAKAGGEGCVTCLKCRGIVAKMEASMK